MFIEVGLYFYYCILYGGFGGIGMVGVIEVLLSCEDLFV